jgi:hypothetical protein
METLYKLPGFTRCAAGTLQTKLKLMIKISLVSGSYHHRKKRFRAKKILSHLGGEKSCQKVSLKTHIFSTNFCFEHFNRHFPWSKCQTKRKKYFI